jgi:hypothetical protein
VVQVAVAPGLSVMMEQQIATHILARPQKVALELQVLLVDRR